MAFVKFLRNTYAGGKLRMVGQVADVSDRDAAVLVPGKAIVVDAPKPVEPRPERQTVPAEDRPRRGRPYKK